MFVHPGSQYAVVADVDSRNNVFHPYLGLPLIYDTEVLFVLCVPFFSFKPFSLRLTEYGESEWK